jgi:ATP-dependent RNA helicase DDX49/DBP8
MKTTNRDEITPELLSYDSSDASDKDLSEHQTGSRKRRKLETVSRVKARKIGHVPTPSTSKLPLASNPLPDTEKTSFASLGVAPVWVASLATMEIKKPTKIQSQCIPEILKGRDCIGGSRTGTGKTVAFMVPILQKWGEDPSGIYAVILT